MKDSLASVRVRIAKLRNCKNGRLIKRHKSVETNSRRLLKEREAYQITPPMKNRKPMIGNSFRFHSHSESASSEIEKRRRTDSNMISFPYPPPPEENPSLPYLQKAGNQQIHKSQTAEGYQRKRKKLSQPIYTSPGSKEGTLSFLKQNNKNPPLRFYHQKNNRTLFKSITLRENEKVKEKLKELLNQKQEYLELCEQVTPYQIIKMSRLNQSKRISSPNPDFKNFVELCSSFEKNSKDSVQSALDLYNQKLKNPWKGRKKRSEYLYQNHIKKPISAPHLENSEKGDNSYFLSPQKLQRFPPYPHLNPTNQRKGHRIENLNLNRNSFKGEPLEENSLPLNIITSSQGREGIKNIQNINYYNPIFITERPSIPEQIYPTPPANPQRTHSYSERRSQSQATHPSGIHSQQHYTNHDSNQQNQRNLFIQNEGTPFVEEEQHFAHFPPPPRSEFPQLNANLKDFRNPQVFSHNNQFNESNNSDSIVESPEAQGIGQQFSQGFQEPNQLPPQDERVGVLDKMPEVDRIFKMDQVMRKYRCERSQNSNNQSILSEISENSLMSEMSFKSTRNKYKKAQQQQQQPVVKKLLTQEPEKKRKKVKKKPIIDQILDKKLQNNYYLNFSNEQ